MRKTVNGPGAVAYIRISSTNKVLISTEFAQTELPFCYIITAIFFSLIKVLLMPSIRKCLCVGKIRDVLKASVHDGQFHTQEY